MMFDDEDEMSECLCNVLSLGWVAIGLLIGMPK